MIRKTILHVTILHHEDDPVIGRDLDELAYEITDGCMIGQMTLVSDELIPRNTVRDELTSIGNDGTFFDDELVGPDDLKAWTVWYTEPGPGKPTFIFECWADDEEHAKEQAQNAYPDAIILEARLD